MLRVLALAILLAHACVAAAAEPALVPQVASSGGARLPEQSAVAFEKADLRFRLDPARRSLSGDATLTFRALQPLQRLVVDLDPRYRIGLVEVDGSKLAGSAWRNRQGRMTVDLPRPLAAGSATTLRIRYAGKPHVAERAPWDGGFVWSRAPTGEPWIATAVQGEGCDLFWPCIDHPMGEPGEVSQHITVPAPLVAAGNGVAEGMDEHVDQGGKRWRTYRWRAKSPNTYAVALNVGPYELLEGEYRSRHGNVIPLRFWHLRGNADKARGLFAEFPPMLDFFEDVIGPYPFGDEKMGVVENPHLGMEHQTIYAYGNDYRKDENGYDWLLHHEFAHEWFGNQLTNSDWSDLWLHEGFGTYMQPLYLQWLRGDMEYMAALMKQRATLANRAPVAPPGPLTGTQVYDDGPGLDLYYKGSLVLHTLRGLIGDKAFFAATRRLVYGVDDPRPGSFRPRHGTTRDFTEAVKHFTGRDHDWFFDVYLRSAQLPELLATRDGERLHLRWKIEGDKPFPMPVQVRVGTRVLDLAMRRGEGSVRVPEGTSYTLDPHSRVLRAMPHIEAFQADRKAREAAGKSTDKRPGQ